MWHVFDVTGQSWLQLEELTLAFGLSALVGLEREVRQKSRRPISHLIAKLSDIDGVVGVGTAQSLAQLD